MLTSVLRKKVYGFMLDEIVERERDTVDKHCKLLFYNFNDDYAKVYIY